MPIMNLVHINLHVPDLEGMGISSCLLGMTESIVGSMGRRNIFCFTS